MAQRIEERVRERVAAALDSEEVQKQIEARLREERAALEQKVTPLLRGVSATHVAPHRPVDLVCLHRYSSSLLYTTDAAQQMRCVLHAAVGGAPKIMLLHRTWVQP